MPCQTSMYDNELSEDFTYPNPEIYNSNSLFPQTQAEVKSHGFLDGANHIVTIAIYPLQYNPVTLKIFLVTNITINVEYKSSSKSPVFPEIRFAIDVPKYDAYLFNTVSNPSDIPLYRNIPHIYEPPNPPVQENYNYVIIYPDDVINDFDDLINWKEQKGNDVRIKSYSQITAVYSEDNLSSNPISDVSGAIRQFLYHQWHYHGLSHVLIVGDMFDPIRKATDYCSDQSDYYTNELNHYPCDLYFSDFQGDWNGNNIQDYYGHFGHSSSNSNQNDDIDFQQELFIGRLIIPLPVGEALIPGSPTRHEAISNWVNKLITYERNPGNGYDGYLNKAVDISALGNTGVNTYLNSHGFITTTIRDQYFEGDLSPSGAFVMSTISNVKPAIISVYGHGNKGRIGIADENINNVNEKNMITSLDRYNVGSYCNNEQNEIGNGLDSAINTTEKYPIFLAASCCTAQFDWNLPSSGQEEVINPSFAEAFTSFSNNYGGPLYIGNTREGAKSDMWPLSFLQKVFSTAPLSFYPDSDPWCGGASFAELRANLCPGIYQSFSLNYFGDPDMDIWTAAPSNLVITLNTQDMSVIVNDQTGTPVNNASVIFKNGSQKQIVSTNSDGYASPTINYSIVTAIKHNYVPDVLRVISGNEEIASLQGQTEYIDTSIFVPENATLTLTGNLELTKRSWIKSVGTLNFSNNTSIVGSKVSETVSGVLYSGNKIVVSGTVSIGTDVSFSSPENQNWDGVEFNGIENLALHQITLLRTPIEINNSDIEFIDCLINFSDSQINNSELYLSTTTLAHSIFNCNNTILTIREGEVNNSPITLNGCLDAFGTSFTSDDIPNWLYNSDLLTTNAFVIIDSCNFNHCGIESQCVDIHVSSLYTNVTRSLIHNYNGDGIYLVNVPSYELTNNIIIDNGGNGINLIKSGNADYCILNSNTIENNGRKGISIFESNCNIEGYNHIQYNNQMGIYAFNYSCWSLKSTPEDQLYQGVSFNNSYQILFLPNSSPDFVTHNCIQALNHAFPLISVYNPPQGVQYNVTYNYWGEDFQPNVDLLPESAFIYYPTWTPGNIPFIEESGATALFRIANNHELSEEYDDAIYDYKLIIENFPKTESAVLAAKALLRIEDKINGSKNHLGYMALKIYYEIEDSLHVTPSLSFMAYSLANICNIRLENYSEAISFYESIIDNPPSYIDSLCAIIDLGFVYILMDSNGDKSGFVGNKPQYKPVDIECWKKSTSSLFGLLDKDIYHTTLDTPSDVYLANNYPNPFNPSTTISFSLPKESYTTLEIYNIKGQKIKTLINNIMSIGKHNIVWNGRDEFGKTISSGVYFYRLSTHERVLTSKMLMLK